VVSRGVVHGWAVEAAIAMIIQPAALDSADMLSELVCGVNARWRRCRRPRLGRCPAPALLAL